MSRAALAAPFLKCAQESAKRPNILLILTDDLGYHDIGCLGSSGVRTPNIDKLVSEGIRLTDFVVNCPVCTPTRAALLTGRYPQRNGLYDLIRNNEVNYGHRFNDIEYAVSPENILGLDIREITIADVLGTAGYKTGLVGKWDSGRLRRFLPLQRGFDFFYGFCNTGIDFWTHERYGVPSMFRGNEPIKEKGYATDLFKREALNFIEQNQQHPFFLLLAFNAPHIASNLEKDYYQAPADYIAKYGEPPGDVSMRYKANITCMDDAVGAVLKRLKKLDLEKNTLVIFTSDNGPARIGDNGPLRGHKGQMYEGGIRVPFVAKWPGIIPANRQSTAFCSALDLFPTFAKLAGAAIPRSLILDGFDMLPVLSQNAPSLRREHYWEWHDKRAARFRNWKWVRETQRKWEKATDEAGELYDLSKDIAESNNLADRYPNKLREMQEKWQMWRREMDRAEPRGPFRDY